MAERVYRSLQNVTLGNLKAATDEICSGLQHLRAWGILMKSLAFDAQNRVLLTTRNNQPPIPDEQLEHLGIEFIGEV